MCIKKTVDGIIGGISSFTFGNVGKYIKIPGITSGRGSFSSVWKQIVTKAKKKLIKNVTAKTLMKGLVAYGGMKFIDQLIDSGRKTLQDTMKEWGRGGEGYRRYWNVCFPNRQAPAAAVHSSGQFWRRCPTIPESISPVLQVEHKLYRYMFEYPGIIIYNKIKKIF